MQDLFDLISGTSTGSYLTATLAMPNDNVTGGSYYAQDVIDMFLSSGPIIFYPNNINLGMLWIITVITAFIGFSVGHRFGKRLYSNPKVTKALSRIKKLIKELKSLKKDERLSQMLVKRPLQHQNTIQVAGDDNNEALHAILSVEATY